MAAVRGGQVRGKLCNLFPKTWTRKIFYQVAKRRLHCQVTSTRNKEKWVSGWQWAMWSIPLSAPSESCIEQKGRRWIQGWGVWKLAPSSSIFSLARTWGFTALLRQQALLARAPTKSRSDFSAPSLPQIAGLHLPTWTMCVVSYQLMIAMLIKTY